MMIARARALHAAAPRFLPGPAALRSAASTRVWLVHASRTGGHRAAAGAVAEALAFAPGVECEVIDALDYMPGAARGMQRAGFGLVTRRFQGAKARAFEEAAAGSERAAASAHRWLRAKAFLARPLLERIEKERPDLLVSTHSQMSVILGQWRRQGRLAAPVHCLITDYDVHIVWADPGVDRYYVATDAVKRRLEAFGADSARIEVTGIPASAAFALSPPGEPADARRALALDPRLPTILMTGGSQGYGPYAAVVEALETHLAGLSDSGTNGRTRALFLAMTGTNREKRESLEAMRGRLANVDLRVYGYVTNLWSYMDAADAVITKPGGMTATELMCRRRPMLFVKPSAGIERHAAAALDALDVVDIAFSPEAAARAAYAEAACPELQASRRAAIETVVRPGAASNIATRVLAAARGESFAVQPAAATR
jgi:processive 1,2-diacylglycerol beta-glucosyltransferase